MDASYITNYRVQFFRSRILTLPLFILYRTRYPTRLLYRINVCHQPQWQLGTLLCCVT